MFAGIASGLGGRKGKGTLILVEDFPLLDRSSLIILQRLSGAGKIFLLSTTRDGQTESPDAHALLEAVSLCGDLVVGSVLSEAEQDEALLELEAEGLAQVALDERRTRVTPAHPVYGVVLRQNMSAFRRRRLYLSQAQALEEHGLRRREDFFRSVARQVEATGTAQTGQLLAAARIARDAHSYDKAVQLLESVPKQERGGAMLMLLRQCLAQVGRTDEVEAVLVQAQRLADGEDEILDAAFAQVQILSGSRGSRPRPWTCSDRRPGTLTVRRRGSGCARPRPRSASPTCC
ncbi:hypothetical protein [Streptomyces antibioticus]|uniref:hypothetical protein n=1 Tax=Streptomyces antibioticus TaxID=1890 RepID=UPI0036B6F903